MKNLLHFPRLLDPCGTLHRSPWLHLILLLRIPSQMLKSMQWALDWGEQRVQLLGDLCLELETAIGKSSCSRPPITYQILGYHPLIEKNSNLSDSQYQQQFQQVD
ncbi:MAG: hypothetical protein O2900_03655 [Proteobacteria bacterium]|nr:hypothetical protein [Pseudomonadota bacterium]